MFMFLITVLVLIDIALLAALVAARRRLDRASAPDLRALEALRADIKALCTGARNMGLHLETLERKYRLLVERQDRLDLYEPDKQIYDHAIRLARKGAQVDELVDHCGLARGEAELLLHVHRSQEH